MQEQSKKTYTLLGFFILLIALLFWFKYDLDASDQHLNKNAFRGSLSLISSLLVYYVFLFTVREKEIKERVYTLGDKVICLYPFIAFFSSAAINDKTTWLCVMTALIITLALLSRGHDRAVDSTFKKLLEKKKHSSPFLSGILVDRMREDQLLKLVESLKDDDDETTILRVSKLGEDKWVLSFPIGIKIGSFMDLILALYLEIDENNPSHNHGVTGYYTFIDGPLEGRVVMITCEEDCVFKFIDNQNISYTDANPHKRRFRLFMKNRTSFTQIENKGEVYIPINLQETISKGAVIKQVKIDNSFA